MDGRIIPFSSEQEDYENSPENSGDSPPSGLFSDTKIASTSSPRRRRGVEKRVVSVPIKAVEGSRLKGEISTPPSDSWAWRKYGQKPIKGSPYPRGYYRCSSSKGCPARKQVERSRADPTMVLVTYSCEHNHSWPASKNNRNCNQNLNLNSNSNSNQNQNQDNNNITRIATITNVAISSPIVTTSNSEDDQIVTIFAMNEEFSNFEGSLNTEYAWFTSFEASSTMLESPILATDGIGESDIATIFSSNEEDEGLFADLGELPECSLVFRREEEERRRSSRTPIFGTTR